MTLLDAARRLTEADHTRGRACPYCPYTKWPDGGSGGNEFTHENDCPTRQLPQIVAALEAAEQVLNIHATSGYPAYWYEMKLATEALRAALAGRVEVDS